MKSISKGQKPLKTVVIILSIVCGVCIVGTMILVPTVILPRVVEFLISLPPSIPQSAIDNNPYDEDWILGKTKSEVEEEYGAFGHTCNDLPGRCGWLYLNSYGHPEFYGEDGMVRLYYGVQFDKDGVAISTEFYWHSEPGG